MEYVVEEILDNDTAHEVEILDPVLLNQGRLLNNKISNEVYDKNKVNKNLSKSLPSQNIISSNERTSQSECPICFDSFQLCGSKRCVVTTCGHVFCFECISQVIDKNGKNVTCPKCRKHLGKRAKQQLISLYDTNISVVDNSESKDLSNKLEKVTKQNEMVSY
jgi:hypothetical protein